MSTFKRYTNKKGQVIVDFQGTLHEETTNTEFHLYDGSYVTKMSNEEYNKPENKTKFEKNKPFWIAKVVVSESEAIEYLKANYNTEMYNGKVNFKCIKRKYMPSVFPPMFFNAEGEKIEGEIAKGSYVNIRAVEETYTAKDRATGKPVTAKKLTLLGVSVLEDNASTGVQQVTTTNTGSDTEEVMDYLKVLMAELKASRKENAKIMKDNAAIIDGLIEIQDELKKELVEVKAELKEIKDKALQPAQTPLQCTQEEETIEEWAEQLPDTVEEIDSFEEYEDEIPF